MRKTQGMVDTHHDTGYRGFASDNYAGVHPEVLAAIAEANGGHQIAYGEDVYTAAAAGGRPRPTSASAPRRSRCSTAPARTSSRSPAMLPRWGAVVSHARPRTSTPTRPAHPSG